ncbi:hypothetical protein Pst134EB_012856 [Puccinia striiformis f. sp. tritici]|nr:hypothetical protein Pst134EB_012856 [Puccinia striiformis f. sp. tritici]
MRYLPRRYLQSISRPTPTNIDMAKLLQLALNSVLLIMFLVGTSSSAPDYSKHNCRTMADARSKRRRAGRKRAGELAPKLEATKPQQDGTPLNQTAKTLAHRIADPKVEVIRKLASRITNALAADISNVGTNEDEAGA